MKKGPISHEFDGVHGIKLHKYVIVDHVLPWILRYKQPRGVWDNHDTWSDQIF